MDYFEYRDNRLFAEDVALESIATRVGTPCYVYSRATIERHYRAFDDAFAETPHRICYAVKANSNLAVLNLLARLGSGFDIVSVGELERVLRAGGEARNIVFSGVGKSSDEIRRALDAGIGCFNIESTDELQRINAVAAEAGQRAPVSLRVNPDVDPQTHPYISTGLRQNKFGIDIANAAQVYRQAAAMNHIEIVGIDCHIGSQLTETAPFVDAARRLKILIDSLAQDGIHLRHVDIGGGLGIRYARENPPQPKEYIGALNDVLAAQGRTILIEPGRAIVGNAGVLLTRVEYLKYGEEHNFAVVDAGMNDLLRPSLYQAWHEIQAVNRESTAVEHVYDVVGPVCETGDFLGKDRTLAITQGDLLAVRSAGAYGFTMSSNYNSRPRAAEVIVDGEQVHVVRDRESLESLFAGEHLLP